MSKAYLAAVRPVAGESAHEFGDRVFTFAQRAVVVDPIAFAEQAFEQLPAASTALRSAKNQTLASLHAQVAEDSFLSGWYREARGHARRAAALQPWRLLRRRIWSVMAEREQALRAGRNDDLRGETVRIVRAFTANNVESRLVGTLAISLHVGRFLKMHDDIDFVTPTAADLDAAVSLLTSSMGYQVTLAYDWTPPAGEPASLRKLDHPSGAKVDIAYLPHWPVRVGASTRVDGVELPIVDLRDLRNTYAVFLVINEAETTSAKRQSDRNTILTLDGILGRAPTVAVLASECDRLPADFPDFPSGPEATRPRT